MARNQSSSPASRRGTEGKQSVSPASEIGLEDKASVPFRSGGGGGGSSRPSGDGGAAARATAARKALAAAEARRAANAKRLAREARQLKDIKRLSALRRAELKRRGFGGRTISAAKKKRGLDRAEERLRKKRRGLIGRENLRSQATGVALGFGSSLLGTARFAKAVVKDPIKTVKAIPAGSKQTAKFVRGGGLARILREEPGFVTGAVAGEVLVTKGGQVVVVRGGRAATSVTTRLTPGFKRVQTIKTKAGVERVIKNLKKIGGKGELRIIPTGKAGPKKVKGKATLPSIRGGFGFSKKEQLAILKSKGRGPTVSSAKGLFGVVKRKVKILPGPEKKELGFFGTPPVKGIGFVRESRLGLGQKVGRFADLIASEVAIGKIKPQIIVVPESKGFKGIGFKESTELETTLKPGLILKKTGKAGTTVLGKGIGQRVPIITAKVVKAPKKTQLIFKKATTGKKLTAAEKKTLKKATGFTSSEISKSFIPKRRISPSTLSGQIARVRGRPESTRRSLPTIRKPVRRTAPRPSPRPRPRPPRGRPTPRPPKRPPVRPPVRPPKRPSIRPPARPPVRPPRRPPKKPPARPPFPPSIKEVLLKIRRKKKKVTKGDIALVEGFTAKALGLKPVKITKANLKAKIKEFQSIGIRRRPVFVKTNKKSIIRGRGRKKR